jgi:hypothetical protein
MSVDVNRSWKGRVKRAIATRLLVVASGVAIAAWSGAADVTNV